jgi:uncharacterized protein DUF6766
MHQPSTSPQRDSRTDQQRRDPMIRRVLRNHGLALALFGFFLIFEIGLSLVGERQYNQERASHHLPQVTYSHYIVTGAFVEATMENWESEFLQMFAYVVLTTFLFQKGSAESKSLNGHEAVDRDPRRARAKPGVPWPVRKGGMILEIYNHSLSLALFLLFAISFALHAVGGAREHSLQELAHGGQAVGVIEYMGTAQFWFESLQNWQSEFFSIGVMIVLSIVLRDKGSPESKPVDAPHSFTGHE